MPENIEEMMKEAKEALVNDETQEALDLCNKVIVLDPENPNAKIMKAVIPLMLYNEEKSKESGLKDYDTNSLEEAWEIADEVSRLLIGITRISEITEEYKYNITDNILDFLDYWRIQIVKHEHNAKDYESESLIVAIMKLFPSRREKLQRKKMKLFLNNISQLSWLQNYSFFIESIAFIIKKNQRLAKIKIVNDAAKLLINVNKDVNINSELGIATNKLKNAIRKRKILKAVKWLVILGLILILPNLTY